MIVDILLLVVGGLVIGALARLLMPGRDPMGVGGTILLGIAGSLIGGLVGRALFGRPGGFLLALVCAMLLLWVMRRTTRRHTLV